MIMVDRVHHQIMVDLVHHDNGGSSSGNVGSSSSSDNGGSNSSSDQGGSSNNGGTDNSNAGGSSSSNDTNTVPLTPTAPDKNDQVKSIMLNQLKSHPIALVMLFQSQHKSLVFLVSPVLLKLIIKR